MQKPIGNWVRDDYHHNSSFYPRKLFSFFITHLFGKGTLSVTSLFVYILEMVIFVISYHSPPSNFENIAEKKIYVRYFTNKELINNNIKTSFETNKLWFISIVSLYIYIFKL